MTASHHRSNGAMSASAESVAFGSFPLTCKGETPAATGHSDLPRPIAYPHTIVESDQTTQALNRIASTLEQTNQLLTETVAMLTEIAAASETGLGESEADQPRFLDGSPIR